MAEMMILRRKQPQTPKGEIRKLIRNKAGKHVGLVIAFKDNCGVHVGWSVCRKTDVYDKDMAETIAKARACEGTKVAPPRFALQQLAEFNERAMNYFNNPNPKPKREKQKA